MPRAGAHDGADQSGHDCRAPSLSLPMVHRPPGGVDEATAEMHALWAQAHSLSAVVHELAALHDQVGAERTRTAAEVAEHRARAAAYRLEALRRRADADTAREQGGLPTGEEEVERVPETRRPSSLEKERARIEARMRRRRERETGFRRYRLGPGRLGAVPGSIVAPTPPEQALDREILAIERALQEHGPTEEGELARMVGSRYWGPAVFSEALRQAVAEGGAKRLSRRIYGPGEEMPEGSGGGGGDTSDTPERRGA